MCFHIPPRMFRLANILLFSSCAAGTSIVASVVNSVRPSIVHRTERLPLFTTRLPWRTALRGSTVRSSWHLLCRALGPMTLTFELDLVRVKENQLAKTYVKRRLYLESYWPDGRASTHRSDCSTWTPKVTDKYVPVRTVVEQPIVSWRWRRARVRVICLRRRTGDIRRWRHDGTTDQCPQLDRCQSITSSCPRRRVIRCPSSPPRRTASLC